MRQPSPNVTSQCRFTTGTCHNFHFHYLALIGYAAFMHHPRWRMPGGGLTSHGRYGWHCHPPTGCALERGEQA
jgi:hypothetical protein